MMMLSSDPAEARQQLSGIVYYMVTFAYIDGHLDTSELGFIRSTVHHVIDHRVEASGLTGAAKEQLVGQLMDYYNGVIADATVEVEILLREAVIEAESRQTAVISRLKIRCYEILRSLEPANRRALVETVDDLIQADGLVLPAELALRGQLMQLLNEDDDVELQAVDGPHPIELAEVTTPGHDGRNDPLLHACERPWPEDPEAFQRLLDEDLQSLDRVRDTLDGQRILGRDWLLGRTSIVELAHETPFLDGHVYVLPPVPGRRYELTVLGDLHGCYSCLKAALMQSRFVEKLSAWQQDPGAHPEPHLVLLGDYIDRGIYSMEGVLRAALKLFNLAPANVHLLRGNHEYFVEKDGEVAGGVRPAEAIDGMRPRVPAEVLRSYMDFFNELPAMLLFDGVVFVHGGIPSELRIRERYEDLSSLNDPVIRFQMMWSDPSRADVVPATLQEESFRFAFGRFQSQAFLQRMGCHTLIRGHEDHELGFRPHYTDAGNLVATVFSAGGLTNDDLPATSGYRRVVPMAITLHRDADGTGRIEPWAIDYDDYNRGELNGFYEGLEEISLF